MLSFIASVMLGVLVGFFAHAKIGASISVAVATSVTLATANFFALQKLATALWDASERQFPPRFPSNAV